MTEKLTLIVAIMWIQYCDSKSCTLFNCTCGSDSCESCEFSCTSGCNSGEAFGIAIGILAFLLVGTALGIGCTIAVIKFIKYMEGKTLTFSPWPRIHSATQDDDPTMTNPTYETEAACTLPSPKNRGTITLTQRPTKRSQPQATAGKTRGGPEMYESIDQSIAGTEGTTIPYAVHDYTDSNMPINSKSLTANKKPIVASRGNAHLNRPIKDENSRTCQSNSGKLNTKKALIKPAIPIKPSVKSELVPSNPQLGPNPTGDYSELDQKASYATLEPHIGEVLPIETHKDSYCHLNH